MIFLRALILASLFFSTAHASSSTVVECKNDYDCKQELEKFYCYKSIEGKYEDCKEQNGVYQCPVKMYGIRKKGAITYEDALLTFKVESEYLAFAQNALRTSKRYLYDTKNLCNNTN